MQQNAIKFNGGSSLITGEAVAIHDFVQEQIESNRSELSSLEEAVKEQLSGKPKKKKKKKKRQTKSNASGAGSTCATNLGMVSGVEVNLGDLDFKLDDIDSDSDDSYAGVLNLT